MGECLEKRILVITSKNHKIDFILFFLLFFLFQQKKLMFPDYNLFLCFQLSIQVKVLCQCCDLVVFKVIKKIKKYSEAKILI